MDWWIWILLGLVLMGLELLTPGGFFLMFFGGAGVTVGALAWIGLTTGLISQGLALLVLVVILMLVRKPLLRRFDLLPGTREVDTLEGETAIATEQMPPGGFGKVELRGTTWNAKNTTSLPIAVAARCRVERVEGLMLLVREE